MIIIKHLHAFFALLSLLGFVLRGVWMIRKSPLFSAKLTKVLPHIIDTGLLVSAITLLVMYQWNPLDHAWVLAKIAALCVYIGLGLLAFRFAKSDLSKRSAWLGALVAIGYIFAVAITKSPSLHLL